MKLWERLKFWKKPIITQPAAKTQRSPMMHPPFCTFSDPQSGCIVVMTFDGERCGFLFDTIGALPLIQLDWSISQLVKELDIEDSYKRNGVQAIGMEMLRLHVYKSKILELWPQAVIPAYVQAH